MKKIFDIGCNVGNWIKANYDPDIRFIGVEASPKTAHICRSNFIDKENVFILNFLVTSESGKSENFYECEAEGGVLSTASTDWKDKGRFANYKYQEAIKVNTISLDFLINLFGIPEEIKIDVEGFELEVLQGLSQKVNLLSFEWSEEFLDKNVHCIVQLIKIGFSEFYLKEDDPYTFKPEKWYSATEIIEQLTHYLPERKTAWGMIYAR